MGGALEQIFGRSVVFALSTRYLAPLTPYNGWRVGVGYASSFSARGKKINDESNIRLVGRCWELRWLERRRFGERNENRYHPEQVSGDKGGENVPYS